MSTAALQDCLGGPVSLSDGARAGLQTRGLADADSAGDCLVGYGQCHRHDGQPRVHFRAAGRDRASAARLDAAAPARRVDRTKAARRRRRVPGAVGWKAARCRLLGFSAQHPPRAGTAVGRRGYRSAPPPRRRQGNRPVACSATRSSDSPGAMSQRTTVSPRTDRTVPTLMKPPSPRMLRSAAPGRASGAARRSRGRPSTHAPGGVEVASISTPSDSRELVNRALCSTPRHAKTSRHRRVRPSIVAGCSARLWPSRGCPRGRCAATVLASPSLAATTTVGQHVECGAVGPAGSHAIGPPGAVRSPVRPAPRR